ncbi:MULTISPECIES: TIGR04222 domain-containing membrane protein [Tsukamurella]|uniref:TIGR04222 domain-containing membrane protein n=2 Tax=Tsukamurella TaxID=2060 RepID=A0A5C5S7D0_9ACTN|nr:MULTISPECIES: TIGR04222 domain-containing membrane protein [Tsukamurella]NMD58172.1 TIGR04222 domain-containing membrane protein [Tsukamurella columbiensis]TWS30792.1 TIGR04222 domain-containing membrane protein [Tsukamurella conjunctivitidis]
MTHRPLASDTWGIPSGDFLGGYLLLCGLTVLAVLIARSGPRRPPRRIAVLSPAETGMMIADGNAVVAALAQLRAAGVIDADGRTVRPVTREDRATLDWFVRSVADRLEKRSTSLVRDLEAPLRQLRSGLVRDGLLRARPSSPGPALLLLPVIALGAVRIVAGAVGAKPVGFLTVAVVAVTATFLVLALRTRRLTPAGRRELAAARQRHAHLHPRLKPSMRTYGAVAAAYAAALFGAAGLAQLDATLAAGTYAAQAGALTPPFVIGGGGGSSSCASPSSSTCGASSSCSSSSSSSSCGGGGCGG